MSHISPDISNSVKPTGNCETCGSPPAANGLKQPTSPGSLHQAQDMNSSSETDRKIETLPPTDSKESKDAEDKEFFKEIRGWLMIVAILAAGSTYQAGLNPPGGVWQSDDIKEGHDYVAGTSVLHDKFFNRYQAFFYCNAISFLSSLVIIIFLMNRTFYKDKARIKVLEITMVLDLFSFMAAYAVGSCRRVTSSIYVFLLMGGVFVYVISFAWQYNYLKKIAEIIPCRSLCSRNSTQQPQCHPV